MIDQRCEPTAADASLADVLVPVDTRAESPLRIVEVQGAQMFQAHSLIEGAQHLADTLGGAEIPARGEQVAGVETDSHARVEANRFQDLRQFRKRPTDLAAGPNAVLQQDRRPLGGIERH